MIFNPKPYERLLKRYLALQATSIDQIINIITAEIVRLTGRANPPGDGDFHFKDYPALSKATDGLLHSLSRNITNTVTSGIEWSWNLANMKNDDMLSRIVKSIGASRIPEGAIDRWSQKNLPALEAFQNRKIGGMNLSDKVWAYTKGIKGDLELAIDLSLGEGKSADSLSRAVRGFLNEPERLYRRVRDEKGVLHLSKAASNYHPGQGVYRSSYKNAKRLAATETNMAYRTSDHDRVQQMDFILGIEVHLSNNHTCLNAKGEPEPFYDICDELQGRYPKDFKFTGWHPLCRCYTTTILPDKDEFMEYLAGMDENGHSDYKFSGEVETFPDGFEKWMSENQNRIALAEQRGNLPYFIRDNEELIQERVSVKASDAFAPMDTKDLQYLASQGIIRRESVGAYEGYASNMLRQANISRLVDERAAFDIGSYMKIYGAKNPEVAELYKEIGVLRGKDEVLRLRKINELKTICGNLSAKEIKKWGFAEGLEYAGVEKNVVLEKAYSLTVNGKTVNTKELRKDLLVFRSGDSKVVFSYPLGARKADIVYDIGEAAKFVGKLPAYHTGGITSVRFVNLRNPTDKYWAAYYKMPGFESYATDGKDITFWRMTKSDQGFFEHALSHETAHIYDAAHNITNLPEWEKAVKADIELFRQNKIGAKFPTVYAESAYTGSGKLAEDFADSLAVKIEYDKKYGPEWFSRLFPNRAKALADIIAKWPNG